MIKLKSKRSYNNEVSNGEKLSYKAVHTKKNRVMYLSVDESVSLGDEDL